MSSTFVTLAEVLEARGGPLVEDEIWSLLLGTAETLVDVSYRGHNSMYNIISPASLLLSATGTLAFKNCALSNDVSTFTAPEMLQGRANSTKPAIERMLVYSLGMTLYWSVDYHLPQNQPVQLSDHLNSLLLSMCEDQAHRRVSLGNLLEACESQHKASLLPSPTKVIRQLVEEVFHESMESGSLPDNNNVHLTGRSQMIRERLHGHGKRGPLSEFSEGCGSAAEGRRYSTDSDSKSGSLPQRPWRQRTRSSTSALYSTALDRLPRDLRSHRDSTCSSWVGRSPHHHPHDMSPKASGRSQSPSITFSESSVSLGQRKAKALGPEFIRMSEEAPVILELPGSLVSKKGRSGAAQREINVQLLNGQTVVVRCDLTSRGRDVFDMVVAHANLVEHFYFGLAFLDDDEYFFLDHETKISKVAPDSWKKEHMSPFMLFLRVKFFVDDISLILHRLTRHQYYLQLRRDIMDDRIHCNDETSLFLGALALQAEFGDYMPELYGKNYYQAEHYVSRRMLERMAIPNLKDELPRLHACHAQMLPEEAELEFLKIAQQLPEYGVMFHRVGREKRTVIGELVLGICAKGIVVCEVKNQGRVVNRRFLWRETDSISTGRRKVTIESGGPSGKKHSFMTESSKIAQYILSLCSAQHKFHSEMTSRQLNHSVVQQDENSMDSMNYMAVYQSRNSSMMKRLSCSDGMLNMAGLSPGGGGGTGAHQDSHSKSCTDLPAKLEARLRQQREQLRRDEHSRERVSSSKDTELDGASLPGDPPESKEPPCWSTPESIPRILSSVSLQKQDSDSVASSSIRVDTPTRNSPEREIICVTLKKDPKLGFGFIIVGEDNTGKLDLGIFIASIVPDGPADKDGRIRPGGRLISLNNISLEGVTFSDAAAILQQSPDEIELIVSQPKQSFKDSKSSLLSQSTLGVALERGFGSQTTLSGTEFRPAMEELEEALALSNMATPKHGKRLHIPVVRILDAQDPFSSRSPSICSLQRAGGEQVEVELKKANGSLGISVAGGINTSVRYGGIYIKSLVSGGAAEQDGRIQIGDRLLEVDGSNLRGVTHKQAVECLKKTGEVVSLILERDLEPRADSPSQPTRPRVSIDTTLSARSKDYSFANQENTMEVVLKKSPTSGLGFSFYISDITSGPDTGTVVRIKRLFAGQPAAESGLLREGDIIISVNGEAVRDLSYQRVLTLLRGAPSEVHLLICRPGARSLGNMDDLLSPAPGNREVRSRSLDIVLDEDYSQLLFKLMTSDVILNEALPDDDEDDWVPVVQPPPAPKAPTLPPAKPLAGCLRLRLDVDRATPSPPAHAPAAAAPPSPPRLPPPSPVSPPTSPPSPMSPPSPVAATSPTSSSTAPATAFYVGPPPPPSSAFSTPASLMTPPPHCAARVEPPSSEEGSERSTATNSAAEQANRSQYATTAEFLDNCPNSKSSAKPVYTSGVREEADGSLTYCLMGNGLTILADEEYLTISSTLEPPYSAPPTSSTARPRHLLGHAPSSTPPPRTPDCAGVAAAAIGPSHSFHGPVLTPPAHRRTGFMPPSFSSDTLVLGHPRPSMMAPQPPPKTAHPLTTQPPKAQQSLLPPGQYSPVFKASKPAPASPPPPPPIITTQVSSSAAHCSGNPRAPAQPSPLTQNHRPTPEPQRKSITYRDYDDDEDEEEERRKGLIKEFELSVVLNKSRSGSFGFTITRSKLDNCYYIQEVLDNPAKTDGRIRAGDRLIMVNGHDVTNVSDDVAMSVLRSSPRRLSMTLGRAVTNLVARPTCDSLPDIVLYKTPSGQLGIKLTGGIGSKWQGIYCLEVVPGSPASEEGSVRPNDKILYICGRCTLGMTLEDAVKACEIAPRKVKLKVLREDQPVTPRAKWNGLFDWKKDRKFFTRFEDSSTPGKEAERAEAVSRSVGTFRQRLSATEQDSCIMQVEFTKPEGGGLGFSLVGGTNGSMLRVNEICYGGAAEQDGRLRVGDILLEVNGVIVSGLSHSKVVDILRKAEGTVQLTICRDIPCYSSEPPGGAADTTEQADPYHSGTDTVQNYGYPAGSDTMQYYPYPAGSDITAYPYPAGGIMADQPPHHVPEASSSADELLIYPVERPHDTTSDHVTNAGDDVFMGSGPHPRPRLAVVRDETVIDQASSCNSTPSHPACCPSLSVTDILHGASDRKQFVTTLLDPPPTPKDIRNHQSDGWSSDDDDDAFEPNGQETTTPPKGPPIVSEEELASLALIAPCKSSQYSGSRVKALIQILQHQLDQQELVKDFMALEHLKPADNCLVGKAPENRDKNRYRDILPYDKTRVPLGESQDYINASYIRMPVGGEEFSYISCQGPLPATVPAFWQMVWENKSDVIAMMTQEVERGRVKCHKYWPERMSAPLTVGRYQLHLDNHQCLEYFYIKIIRMVETETGETHFVRHLKFTRWPDHGVPRCSEQLVRFIRYLRAVHHKGPVTVHCSAGIGRAGVLICTDIILSLIENDLPINVIDIVKQMRLQRYGMIQTKEQYLFCYKVWLEVLQGILQLHGNQWQPDSPRDHKVV